MRKNIRSKLCWLALAVIACFPNYKIVTLAQTPPHNLPSNFRVKEIKINGSSIFKPADFQAIVKPLIGKEVSLERILQLRTAITDLYVEKGYTTSGAFFPVQDGSDGVINIQIIEGKLENIEISGLQGLSKNYVESRLQLAADQPLNIRELEQAIGLLKQNSLLDSVDAQLVSGSAPGQSILKLDLAEAANINTRFTVANDESPNIGEYRATAALTYQNLLGFGDRFSTEYDLTSGLDRFGASYSVPINARDGNLFISYGNNNSEITNSFFAPVDIESESQSLNFGLRQPVIRNPQSELALSLALDLRDSDTIVNDDSVSLDPDRLGESGESDVTALRLGQ